jgi:hypothetical protein
MPGLIIEMPGLIVEGHGFSRAISPTNPHRAAAALYVAAGTAR